MGHVAPGSEQGRTVVTFSVDQQPASHSSENAKRVATAATLTVMPCLSHTDTAIDGQHEVVWGAWQHGHRLCAQHMVIVGRIESGIIDIATRADGVLRRS